MNLPLIIIGAGGHGAVVADALMAAGGEVLGFTDADVSRCGSIVCGRPVLGDDRALLAHSPAEVLLVNGLGGIGNTSLDPRRERLQRDLEAQGWTFAAVRHPSAIVSPYARVGRGAHLLAACVVQAGADVGMGCIVNTAAVVEHDVVLGDWVHVAPGAVLCGGVWVGGRSHIGAGAVVRQGVRLGAETIVAAGAVVVRDEDGGVLVGVPARRREEHA